MISDILFPVSDCRTVLIISDVLFTVSDCPDSPYDF